MPSIRKKENKAGQIFYEIQVSRGRSRSRLTSRWYPPEGWSQKAIDRELAKVAAEFERRCDNGEAISRAEQKKKTSCKNRRPQRFRLCVSMGSGCLCPQRLSQSARIAEAVFRATLTVGYIQHSEK